MYLGMYIRRLGTYVGIYVTVKKRFSPCHQFFVFWHFWKRFSRLEPTFGRSQNNRKRRSCNMGDNAIKLFQLLLASVAAISWRLKSGAERITIRGPSTVSFFISFWSCQSAAQLLQKIILKKYPFSIQLLMSWSLSIVFSLCSLYPSTF